MTHTDREAQYIKETGDAKPVYHNSFADYHYKIKEWFERFSTWLSQQLEKVEKENNV